MSRILTTLTCLCISYLAIGQTSEKIMVYGHVANLDTRAPLEGAWVYLMDSNRQLLDSVQADRKGMNYKDAGYMFSAKYLPGQYHMKIVYPGYYSPVIPFELKSDSEPLPTAYIKKVLEEKDTYAWGLGDEGKTKIEILKESPAYARDEARKEKFEYALPDDSLLTRICEEFHLDKIAGKGDDISKIKNLLYWVHNNIRHDGGHGFPEGPRTLPNIYHSAKRNNCGYNCRALAIALTEAYLSVGIPARYLTCQSKAWDTDPECHVICVAWSKSLGKWVWVDPTMASYVTDGNGLLLHPGEVRYRLQHDMPVELNEDANWNNEIKQTKEEYLENYMAKNLYILSARMRNQAEPEGSPNSAGGTYAALVPEGSNFNNAHIITTDDGWFWQPPED